MKTKIIKSAGLDVSLKVLDSLKRQKGIGEVYIGTFTNCRECGLTFIINDFNHAFTFCVYEHRNSDEIIINGKEGFISANGDLPYNGETKWDYLKVFKPKEFEACAESLAQMIVEKRKEWNKKSVEKMNKKPLK